MDEQERWTNVCEPKLAGIEDNVKRLVKVVIDGNGTPGLVTRMAVIEKSVEGLSVPETKQVASRKEKIMTNIKTPIGELSTNDPRVANGLRIAIILVGIAAFYFITDHMKDTRNMMLQKMEALEDKVETND